MSVTLSLFAGAGAQFLDNNGVILSGGLIYTYTAGTTTPLTTYTSNLGTTAQPNPIVLDASGRIPGGELWLTTGFGYKFVTKDSNGVLIGTYDNVPSSAQPPITNDASSIAYEEGSITNAGSFVIGETYQITYVGTTNFQLIGATSNTIGLHFIATGVGSGTGTAEFSRTVQNRLQDFVSVKDFGAVGDGTTDDTTAINLAIASAPAILFPVGTYKITSNIELTIPFMVMPGATLQIASGNVVTMYRKTCNEVNAIWFGNDGVAIQNAINSGARYIKEIFVPAGVWEVSTPILFPQGVTNPDDDSFYGVRVRGASPSQKYGLSTGGGEGGTNVRIVSTILKATATMDYVIGCRPSITNGLYSGYMSTSCKLDSITIDGQNKVDYGYINGMFDYVTNCSIGFCNIASIVGGDSTISFYIQNCSLAHSKYGVLLTGSTSATVQGDSTTVYIQNCRIRENTQAGLRIVQGASIKITDCIFEANLGYGIDANVTAEDSVYATYSPYINNVTIIGCYWEGNYGVLKAFGNTTSYRVNGITLYGCYANNNYSSNPITSDLQFNFYEAFGITINVIGLLNTGFTLGTNVDSIQVFDNPYSLINDTSSIPSINGVNAAFMEVLALQKDGGLISTYGTITTRLIGYQVGSSSSSTFNINNTAGSFVTGGSNTENVIYTLYKLIGVNNSYPTTSFIFFINADNASYTTQLSAPSGVNIIYNGASYSTLTSQSLANNAVRLTSFFSGGIYYWMAEVIYGTWTPA